MPELPEVETVVRELQKSLIGNKFAEIITLRDKIREEIPDLSVLEGKKIKSVERRAKYIIINGELVIHLGMSGTIRVGKPQERKKHDHVVFNLNNGEEMVFNDPRRFGLVTLYSDRLFKDLGPEPLSDNFNAEYLKDALKNKKAAIKPVIMDQAVVVGVGNIYVAESLFMTGINPTTPANKIKKHGELVKNIRKVLEAAIESGGSTLRDYVRSSGDLGYFQHQHFVYGKEKTPCQNCGTEIKRLVQAQRSTFYCPKCQK
jgi:formamidopyrimidine-DNA glycosylase